MVVLVTVSCSLSLGFLLIPRTRINKYEIWHTDFIMCWFASVVAVKIA